MGLRHSLLTADIAEDIQLLFVFSERAFLLSDCVVATREFSGTRQLPETYLFERYALVSKGTVRCERQDLRNCGDFY